MYCTLCDSCLEWETKLEHWGAIKIPLDCWLTERSHVLMLSCSDKPCLLCLCFVQQHLLLTANNDGPSQLGTFHLVYQLCNQDYQDTNSFPFLWLLTEDDPKELDRAHKKNLNVSVSVLRLCQMRIKFFCLKLMLGV